MKIIGLTGGIGAGKSEVAKLFELKGVKVFNSDIEAKKILFDPKISIQIKNIFGVSVFTSGIIDEKKLANLVFKDKKLLNELNSIIHPLHFKNFEKWKNSLNITFVIKESAILFETKTYESYDKIILVYAPKLLRIKRVQARDNSSIAQIERRMNNQIDYKKVKNKADYLIYNNEVVDLEYQIQKIYKNLISLYGK